MIKKELIELSEYRLNKAKELRNQSQILLDNHMYDGSINRSYYSIFYAIRSVLCLAELDSTKHSGILSLFDRYFVKSGIFNKDYSNIVHTAFDIRQDTDYEDFYAPSLEEAKDQFQNAEKVMKEVEEKTKRIIDGKLDLPKIE